MIPFFQVNKFKTLALKSAAVSLKASQRTRGWCAAKLFPSLCMSGAAEPETELGRESNTMQQMKAGVI